MKRSLLNVKSPPETMLQINSKSRTNFNIGEGLPSAPQTVDLVNQMFVSGPHTESKIPVGNGIIDVAEVSLPLGLGGSIQGGSYDNVGIGSGVFGHPLDFFPIGPIVESGLNRPVSGKTSVQSLNTGLHGTHGPMKQKIIDGGRSTRRETSVPSFSNLHVGKIVGEPNGHVTTRNIEIPRNDKAEASVAKLVKDGLQSLESDGLVDRVPIEADDNNLPQTVVLNLNRHAPMAVNDAAGTNDPNMVGPQETNSPRVPLPTPVYMAGAKQLWNPFNKPWALALRMSPQADK
jgi:hypothetical protein